MTMGKNTLAGEQLSQIIESVERLTEEKKDLQQEITAKFAEAKSAGLNTTVIRNIIRRRAAKPHDLQEHDQLMELYQHSLGMLPEPPLFRAVGLAKDDDLARETIIEHMKGLVPPDGEIILKIGKPVRIFRVKDGEAQVEDYAPPAPKAAAAGGPVFTKAPKPDVPNCNAAQASDLGEQAFRDNQPITGNPFPFGDERRAAWDRGWRKASGSDGMGPNG